MSDTSIHMKVTRPIPVPDEDSAPFWEATARRQLVLQRCDACGLLRFYPRALCPGCWSFEHEWLPVSGLGTIASYTIVRRAPTPAFRDAVPYVVALVDLDEGPRMLTNIVGTPIEDVRIDMRIQVDWEELGDNMALPVFRPVSAE